MTEQHRLRVKTLFAQAADLPRHERDAFLEAACRGEADLRAEVEELLAYDLTFGIEPDEDGFLKSPLVRAPEGMLPGSSLPPLRDELALPLHIGRYRILRQHGEGGMGTVYEAEQDNPRRTVALKVIRPGLVSPELVKRFSHEAQILARLQHSGIAQVYEAGMGADGQPFFAMEFIRGMPLDEYSRSCRLDPAARLELLARVCDAVQHAHDKGVIHRDLKPANILVDETGQPKVLDFGVAHVTAADLLTTASRTQAGQLLGTLSYMSPEQIAADPAGLDGRSDVYTLGVILFELLVHRLPYQLEQLPAHEVARVIQQQEPSRLGSIDTIYRGDVEIVVGKTLEKDRTRRYASAGHLASDIRRYLRGEAILARPPSALYQLRKFARRHKALVAGASGIFAAFLMGTVVSIVFALRAADNARVAAENARIANEHERAANYQSYRARIVAAVAALSHHNVVDAARQLDAAPEAFRDWEWRHLRTRLDDSTSLIPPVAGASLFVIHDPKGSRIARSTPTSLHLNDLEGNELLSRSFPPETNLIYGPPLPTRYGLRLMGRVGSTAAHNPALAQSPVTAKGIVNVLDDQGRVQTQLKGPPGKTVNQTAVSADGSRLAVIWIADEDWILTVYDPDSGRQTATSTQSIGFTWDLVFSPDGTSIAIAGEDGRISLWDASTGAMILQWRGHASKVLSIAFRPDGRRLVTASADGTVRQWDSSTGREVESRYDRHIGEVLTAEYSPDGLWIASGGTDRTVRVWSAANQQDLAVLQGHTSIVSDLAFALDSRHLASVSTSGWLAYAEDGTARFWEVGRQAGTSVLRGHTSYIYPVAYSPDGRRIASGSWDNTVRVWDAVTGESCAILPHSGSVRALAFGPDSSWLVSGCERDKSLQIWNVATAQLEKKFKGPGSHVFQAIAVSSDGARIAAADSDGSATIIETETGEEVHSFRMAIGIGEKKALAYSPDGRLLAGTGEVGTQIDIWDTRTYRRSIRLTGHEGPVFSVAFSRDGHLLASASGDHTVRVWDLAAAKCVAVLTGHTDSVFSAIFHPDGKRLASAGRDRAIWLWDLATGQDVARLEGHTNYVFSLAFSPDGKSLVSGSGDGTVRIWDTAPPALRYKARRAAETRRREAERLVSRLFAELREPTDVFAHLRSIASLSDPLRHAAVREVMLRGQQAIR
jgi:WD40 repeat protein/predicted Ser/Thr protein kinase